MAVPAFASVNAHGDATPTTACTITAGATAANNILILQVINGGANAAVTLGGTYTGSAWTSIDSGGWTSGWGGVWWSRCSTNHTTQTITITGATDSTSAQYTRISGALSTATPIDTNIASATVAAGANVALASFNTVRPDDLVMFCVEIDDNLAISSPTMGGVAMSNLSAATSTGGADSGVACANLRQAQAGATGAFAMTVLAGTNEGKRATAFGLMTDTPGTVPDLVMPGADV